MAIAWPQQAFSFILNEGICSWATESVVCLHAHCSGQICSDCCWGDKVEPWLRKRQHTGFLAEVAGCSASVCSLETDLLAVRCWDPWMLPCRASDRVWVKPSRFPVEPTRQVLCHIHKRMLVRVTVPRSLISSLPRLIRLVWVCLRGLRNANWMRDITSNKEACHRGRSGGRGLKADY